MNKYILIGGCQEKANLNELSRAVFPCNDMSLNFLICLFARNSNLYDWNVLFNDNIAFFRSLSPEHEINFILANEKDFITQIESANIIYFSGGDSIPLYSALARIGNKWVSRIINKTVIGTSAGTDLLCRYNYDFQQSSLAEGMGIVPIKTIVHYGEKEGYYTDINWEHVLAMLKGSGETLPIYPLREGEFVVVEA